MAGNEARQRHRYAANDRDGEVGRVARGFVYAVAREHVHTGNFGRHAVLLAPVARSERARQGRFVAPRDGLSSDARPGTAGAIERAEVFGVADRPRREDGAGSAAGAKPAGHLGAAAVGGENRVSLTYATTKKARPFLTGLRFNSGN